MKIAPSGKYIQSIIDAQNTEVVVLLGVRKAESIARKKRMEGRELLGHLLNRHETIKKAFVYPAISELATDDVWDILGQNQRKTAWGGDNNQLINLYAGADSGECPFAGISSKDEQQQSCGQSRFGCWVCTVVKEDKSLNGFICSGHRELKPLAEFRTWLMGIRDCDEYREKKRRDGTVYHTSNNELGYGPFTWEARQMILRKLLKTQQRMNYELITIEELQAIDKIWDDEKDITRRTLVDLYFEETGMRLPWDELKHPLFDASTCEKIRFYAQRNNVPLDLINAMIFGTNTFKYYSNTKGLRDKLTKAISQQWLQEKALCEPEEGDSNGTQES